MRSKLLGLFVALSLLLGVLTPALADDTIVATFDNTVNPVEHYTVEDLNSHRSISGGILTLKDDVTLNLVTTESVSAGQNGYVGFVLEYGHIDLNGHTLTFVLPEITTSPDVIWGIYCIENSTVKNGTIKIDAASSTGAMFNAVIMVYGAINPQFGMPDVNNVEFVSGNASSETAVNFMLGQTTPMVIKNCVVGSGFDTAVGVSSPIGTPTDVGKMVLESGSYKNLTTNNYVVVRGTKLTTPPAGVSNDTTVIVSDDTTAIIVDDGNAYLYDTLQDAVDAVDADGTIQLLKQPTEGKVTVPDDPQFSISAFGEGVNTSDLQLVTQDGKKVVVGTDGAVEVVNIPATGIALDKTSAEVFSGETVTLTATVEPIDTTDTVTWSTSDAAVATVNADGVVTGVSQGTAIITAKAGNVSATCTVTVDPTWKVMLDNELKEVLKGDPFTFPAAPTKPGYIFMGWRGADGATYQPGDEVAITGDTSFKAIWANMPDITPGTPDEPDDEPDVDVFPFYDVSAGAWYYDAVKYVWEHELMNGVSATQFSPNTTLNRAMIWTMLARLDGVNTDGGASWYAKAQEWAMAEGVSDGTDPMGAVTREQLVTMLWRFKGEPTVDFLLTAKDADTVSSWAYEAMRWAVAEGIIEGDENGMISPTATATRAQAAAIFMRFIEL